MEQSLFYITIGSLLSIIAVTFKLVLDRMDTQEKRAALDISTLRQEITSTALAAKENVSASAFALREQVASASQHQKNLSLKKLTRYTLKLIRLKKGLKNLSGRKFNDMRTRLLFLLAILLTAIISFWIMGCTSTSKVPQPKAKFR
jgi:hypothetical protein